MREPDPRDRRVRVPVITERGREVQQRVEELHARVEREFTAGLTPQEQHALRATLERLIATDGGPDSGSCL